MDTNCFSDLPEGFWRESVISFEFSFSEADYWEWAWLICNGIDLV